MRKASFVFLLAFIVSATLGLLFVCAAVAATSPTVDSLPRGSSALNLSGTRQRTDLAVGLPAASPALAAPIRVWESIPLPTGVTTRTISNIAVHPANPFEIFLSSWNGLYRSTNAGDTWIRLQPDTWTWASDVSISEANPARIYTQTSGLYRSDNGGSSWTQVTMPPSSCGLYPAPSAVNRLYARACSGQKGEPAIYRSDDGGQSWIAPSLTFTTPLSVLAISPVNPDLLIGANFDRVYRSADGGGAWSPVGIGTRYFGHPEFDPAPPHVLYLGHWTGLLRSADGGQTWQDSDANRELSTIIVAPWGSGEILGGNRQTAWRIASSGNRWQAGDWLAPMPLTRLYRSSANSQVLYAQSDSGLWRLSNRPTLSTTFLPLVGSAGGGAGPAQTAIDRANVYRGLVGLQPLLVHPAIVAATQNHANYHLLNAADPSAWTNGAHGEVVGKPGFTGTWPSDRMRAAGYPWGNGWWGGSEVMHFIGDPLVSVDGWMATIYHRVIVLDAGASYSGYGSGRSSQTAVDVMDFGSGPTSTGGWSSATPYPLAYPADGQTNVPSAWGGGEFPDPLPPGAPRPVGYPFTLQGVRGALQVTWAELRQGTGELVAVYPNPADCQVFNCYALIAVTPLQPGTVYIAHARGSVRTVPFDRSWSFTTTSVANGPNLPGAGVERPLGPPLLAPTGR